MPTLAVFQLYRGLIYILNNIDVSKCEKFIWRISCSFKSACTNAVDIKEQ
jgi:hypothetical protein